MPDSRENFLASAFGANRSGNTKFIERISDAELEQISGGRLRFGLFTGIGLRGGVLAGLAVAVVTAIRDVKYDEHGEKKKDAVLWEAVANFFKTAAVYTSIGISGDVVSSIGDAVAKNRLHDLGLKFKGKGFVKNYDKCKNRHDN